MENVTMRPEESIAWFVNARIGSIQNDYLSAKGKSRGARKLASLRHSLLMSIGSDADAWLLEFEGLPSALVGSGQEPSAGEVAVHAAMTLYAFHQQGQSRPMHIRGVGHGIGSAIRQLVIQEKDHYSNLEVGEMPRRFRAFITAETMDETLHYARQMVQQLRGAGIAVDYAKLAAQLYSLQSPYKVDQVRLAWGREYAFADNSNNDSFK